MPSPPQCTDCANQRRAARISLASGAVLRAYACKNHLEETFQAIHPGRPIDWTLGIRCQPEPGELEARDLLAELCDDLLDVQIGTSMFWKDDDELRDDHFTEYVHYHLLRASRLMKWEHYDSSKIWERESHPN